MNNNVYGILYTVHTGANALRKNPSNDKAIVFDGDGDAGPVDIENAILHASLEPVSNVFIFNLSLTFVEFLMYSRYVHLRCFRRLEIQYHQSKAGTRQRYTRYR